jgi:hypothetical protein
MILIGKEIYKENIMITAKEIVKNISEIYVDRFKSIYTKQSFEVYLNPNYTEIKKNIGNNVRFTALKQRGVYVWDADIGFHDDVTRNLKLDSFVNIRLAGEAYFRNGKYEMIDSDQLTDAFPTYLSDVLSIDWSWVDKYIIVSPYLNKLRKEYGIEIDD